MSPLPRGGGYFLPLSKPLHACSFAAARTHSSFCKTGCVFVFVWPAELSLPHMLAEYCLSDYLSLTASLVYLSDSIVRKSSLEVGCVRACHVKDRGRCF